MNTCQRAELHCEPRIVGLIGRCAALDPRHHGSPPLPGVTETAVAVSHLTLSSDPGDCAMLLTLCFVLESDGVIVNQGGDIMPFFRTSLALGGTALLVFAGVAPPGAGASKSGVADFVDAVAAVAPEVFTEDTLAPGDRRRDVEIDADETMTTAELTFSGLSVGLPVGEGAQVDRLPSGDVAVIGDTSTFGAVEKADGSVQVVFTANDATSPTEFSFDIPPVDGASFKRLDNGAVWYVDADDSLIVGAAPPWARDANGDEVPTHFEIRDNSLVQIVEHRSSHTAYPVVADPWLGIDLFSKITQDTYNGQLRVNLWKSTWGNVTHAPNAAGIEIMLSSGWAEATAKAPRLNEKATLRQQYECHVWGGFYNIATGEWNLEKFRPTRTTTWVWGVARHRCNWTTANEL